jgi:DNA-binding NarL/FixJ family response regulator
MKVLIADDHDLVRDTICAFLESEGFETTGVPDYTKALAHISRDERYDVVLLDYMMPGASGLDGLTKMIDAGNGTPVALLSGTASQTVVDAAMKNGASGYIPKSMPAKSMANAIRFIASGERYIPFGFDTPTARSPQGGNEHNLSDRELQVLMGLCEGKSNKEIARDCDLQEVTIKLHVKNLCRKIKARNRTHAAMIARNLQLV